MPSVATEGIILKRKNFGEADRVLTVLTKHLGKISIIAKGVRRITSRRAGNIEVLNRVKLHLFKSKNYNLTEAQSLETYQQIKANLMLSTTAFHILELIDRMVASDQLNPQVYPLAIAILELLEKNPRQIFIRGFEVKLLNVSGFWAINALPELTSEVKSLLETLQYSSWEKINQIKIGKQTSQALEDVLHAYLEKVLESKLKSIEVMRQLKR